MLDAIKQNCITGGTVSYIHVKSKFGDSFHFNLSPLTLACVTAPKAPSSDLSVHIRKRHVQDLQKTPKILSAGAMDSDILL